MREEVDGRASVATLTRREREVLDAMWLSGDEKSAARGLGISVRTLQTHLQNIHLKLEVGHTLEAIRLFKESARRRAGEGEEAS